MLESWWVFGVSRGSHPIRAARPALLKRCRSCGRTTIHGLVENKLARKTMDLPIKPAHFLHNTEKPQRKFWEHQIKDAWGLLSSQANFHQKQGSDISDSSDLAAFLTPGASDKSAMISHSSPPPSGSSSVGVSRWWGYHGVSPCMAYGMWGGQMLIE